MAFTREQVSEQTGAPDVIDYTLGFMAFLDLFKRQVEAQESMVLGQQQIITKLDVISTKVEALTTEAEGLREKHAELVTVTEAIRDIQSEFTDVAGSRALGIYVNEKSDWDPDGNISRAITVDALRAGDRLDDVRNEIQNPTPLP